MPGADVLVLQGYVKGHPEVVLRVSMAEVSAPGEDARVAVRATRASESSGLDWQRDLVDDGAGVVAIGKLGFGGRDVHESVVEAVEIEVRDRTE